MLFQSRSHEDVHDHGRDRGLASGLPPDDAGPLQGHRHAGAVRRFPLLPRNDQPAGRANRLAPAGRTSLAVPLSVPLAGTFQPARRRLCAARAARRRGFRIPHAGRDAVGISAASDMVDELCEAEFGASGARKLRHVTRLSDEQGVALGVRLSSLIDDAQRNPGHLEYAATRKMFRDAMLGMFLDALEQGIGVERRDITHATYSDIVSRCEKHLRDRPEEPVTVLELPRAALQPPHAANEFSTRGRRHAGRLSAHDPAERGAPPAAHDAVQQLGVGEAAASWGSRTSAISRASIATCSASCRRRRRAPNDARAPKRRRRARSRATRATVCRFAIEVLNFRWIESCHPYR